MYHFPSPTCLKGSRGQVRPEIGQKPKLKLLFLLPILNVKRHCFSGLACPSRAHCSGDPRHGPRLAGPVTPFALGCITGTPDGVGGEQEAWLHSGGKFQLLKGRKSAIWAWCPGPWRPSLLGGGFAPPFGRVSGPRGRPDPQNELFPILMYL